MQHPLVVEWKAANCPSLSDIFSFQEQTTAVSRVITILHPVTTLDLKTKKLPKKSFHTVYIHLLGCYTVQLEAMNLKENIEDLPQSMQMRWPHSYFMLPGSILPHFVFREYYITHLLWQQGMFSIVLVFLAYASEFHNISFPEYIYSLPIRLHAYELCCLTQQWFLFKKAIFLSLEVSWNSFIHLLSSSNICWGITGNVGHWCWGQGDLCSKSQTFMSQSLCP